MLKAFVCLAISRFSSYLLMVHFSGDSDRLESMVHIGISAVGVSCWGEHYPFSLRTPIGCL